MELNYSSWLIFIQTQLALLANDYNDYPKNQSAENKMCMFNLFYSVLLPWI